MFSSVKYNFASRKKKLVHALTIIGKTRSLHGYHNSFLPGWKGLLNLLTVTITTIFINFLFPITHNYSDLHGSYFVMLRNRQCERNLSTLDAFQSWCWMLLRKKKKLWMLLSQQFNPNLESLLFKWSYRTEKSKLPLDKEPNQFLYT